MKKEYRIARTDKFDYYKSMSIDENGHELECRPMKTEKYLIDATYNIYAREGGGEWECAYGCYDDLDTASKVYNILTTGNVYSIVMKFDTPELVAIGVAHRDIFKVLHGKETVVLEFEKLSDGVSVHMVAKTTNATELKSALESVSHVTQVAMAEGEDQ